MVRSFENYNFEYEKILVYFLEFFESFGPSLGNAPGRSHYPITQGVPTQWR